MSRAAAPALKHATGDAAMTVPPLLDALRGAFASLDPTGEGRVPVEALRPALERAGAASAARAEDVAALEAHAAGASGFVFFAEFVALALAGRDLGGSDTFLAGAAPRLGGTDAPPPPAASAAAADEGPDEGVIEFLASLEDHRLASEREGNYEEAARCLDKLAEIRAAEELRRVTALQARHVVVRNDVAAAQAAQFRDFNATWYRYLSEYDAMATLFVTRMQADHLKKLQAFQEALHAELVKKPVKLGKEVLEWRAREALLVRQEKYGEAARIKAMCDELERRERARIDEERLASFSQREARFRAQQRAELETLLTRFNGRRDGAREGGARGGGGAMRARCAPASAPNRSPSPRPEHVKQRDIDLKRLLQRNKNVLKIVDERNVAEAREIGYAIRLSLMPPRSSMGHAAIDTGKKRRGEGPSAASRAAAASLRAEAAAPPRSLFSPPRPNQTQPRR